MGGKRLRREEGRGLGGEVAWQSKEVGGVAEKGAAWSQRKPQGQLEAFRFESLRRFQLETNRRE